MTPAQPARIFLLPAKEASYVAVIRRKPSNCFHLIRWNTKTDALEHGSWFSGRLFPDQCDVSFDGQWMVYLAMGQNGQTWNGICYLPFLKTVAEGPNMGTWNGGGYWKDKKTLILDNWLPEKGRVPFELEKRSGGSNFRSRWERDGWQYIIENEEVLPEINEGAKARKITVWKSKPSGKHPTLVARPARIPGRGSSSTFIFSLEKFTDVLDEKVDAACWDSLGQLVFAREGVLYKYSLKDLKAGRPRKVIDLESLQKTQQ